MTRSLRGILLPPPGSRGCVQCKGRPLTEECDCPQCQAQCCQCCHCQGAARGYRVRSVELRGEEDDTLEVELGEDDDETVQHCSSASCTSCPPIPCSSCPPVCADPTCTACAQACSHGPPNRQAVGRRAPHSRSIRRGPHAGAGPRPCMLCPELPQTIASCIHCAFVYKGNPITQNVLTLNATTSQKWLVT